MKTQTNACSFSIEYYDKLNIYFIFFREPYKRLYFDSLETIIVYSSHLLFSICFYIRKQIRVIISQKFLIFLAMLNACQELVQLIQNQGRKWQKAIQFERDARSRMERMCEQVASQTVRLEKQMQRASRNDKKNHGTGLSSITSIKSVDLRGTSEGSNLSDDDEFYDAIDDPQTIGVFRIPYVVIFLFQ